MTTRLEQRFADLKAQDKGGLVTFMTAGYPDEKTTLDILKGLPAAGVDVIELGMPFSDPMADGPAIQASSLHALNNGMTLAKTLDLVADFRKDDQDTPIILMGYYNPIYSMGNDAFLDRAKAAGVDGFIIVDLPPEEDDELCLPALEKGLHWIRLATPTTDAARMPKVLQNTSGFLYYVSIMGITGTASAAQADVATAIGKLKEHTDLPIAVGFGIKTPDNVRDTTASAEAAVVGSALVDRIKSNLDGDGKAKPGLVEDVLSFVRELASGKRG
ncbi:tryptophan synthase subunit alpha [Rhodovibrionaceae bacterium A322]